MYARAIYLTAPDPADQRDGVAVLVCVPAAAVLAALVELAARDGVRTEAALARILTRAFGFAALPPRAVGVGMAFDRDTVARLEGTGAGRPQAGWPCGPDPVELPALDGGRAVLRGECLDVRALGEVVYDGPLTSVPGRWVGAALRLGHVTVVAGVTCSPTTGGLPELLDVNRAARAGDLLALRVPFAVAS